MKKFALTLGFTFVVSGATAQAATHEHDMSRHQAMTQTAAKHAGIGVLKAVNNSKVQIAHDSIAELGWPAMTMWFTLRDPPPPELKTGDAVRFEMLQNDKKQWVIVKIGRK